LFARDIMVGNVEGIGLQMIILTIICEEPPVLFYAQ
jgi:hypothetical protein